MKRTFHFNHQQARQRAAQYCQEAPEGSVCIFSDPTRSFDQMGFIPLSMGHVVCGKPECVKEHIRMADEKTTKRWQKAERIANKAKRESLKTRSDWTKQCKRCNRDLGGRVVDFRTGLVARIGVEKVEAIEAIQTARKFDIDYVKRITNNIFTRKAKRVMRWRGFAK